MSLSVYEEVQRYTLHEGTDYGSTGRCILRHKEARVVWRPGHSVFAGIGSRAYAEAKLRVEHVPSGHGGTTSVQLLAGGRLSKKRWSEVREKIAEALGVPLKLVPKSLPPGTVVIP